MLCESLFTLFNFQVSAEDSRNCPEKRIQAMGKIINHWEQTDLLAYMDLDKLITTATVLGYAPKSEVRTQGVQRVLRHAQRLVDEGYVPVRGEMPLFTELSRYVNDELALGRQLSSQKSSNSSGYTSNNRNNYSNNFKNQNSAPKGTESAALAKAEDSEKKEARGPYHKEIHRSDNLWVKDKKSGNYMFYYTATKNPCPRCNSPTTCPTPKCFLKQCTSCQLYGHKPQNCLQAKVGATANAAQVDAAL
jgi:hypothetical protein